MGNPNQPRDERGRWKKGSSAAVVTVVVGGGALVGVSGPSAWGPSGALNSQLSSAARVKVNKGKLTARSGNQKKTWKDLGFKRTRKKERRDFRCAVTSYGDVRRFFFVNPCRSVRRVLVKLDDKRGTTILLSVSWVQMKNARSAERLRDLADEFGTGNVSPLPSALVNASDLDWTGRYYGSRREGRVTVIAEAEPVSGSPEPAFVDGVAEVASHLPRP